MKKFMDSNFLLNNETAITLFHNYAKKMPIYDFHCHVNVNEIYENKNYENITQLWLYGDHYKWRAMRAFGIDESYITGEKSDFEKFFQYAKMIGFSIGNPLYHWTHLELQRYFNIFETLNENTAKEIWNKTLKMLETGNFKTRDLIKMSNVKAIVSTDDPVDDLKFHTLLKSENYETEVLPAFRPDKGLAINASSFNSWLKALENSSKVKINNYTDFLTALENRITFFDENGCKFSDHGFDYIPFVEASKEEVSDIFAKKQLNETLTEIEEDKYKTFTLQFLAKEYYKRKWVMQFHIGTMRNNNTSMFKKIGADTGFDSINDYEIARPLSKLLNSFNETGLPKTILYTLNPKDNYVLGSMIGNFQDGKIAGKIQFGSAWWFNDQKDGMIAQLGTLANLGLLSKFVGMLTDSRSFLSYIRHEYFRRILCNLIGEMVENGEFPPDFDTLQKIVCDISYNNIAEYINQ